MNLLSLNQVKPGSKIIFRELPNEVITANHLMVGRGGAKLSTKLRNLIDGAVIDYTFHGEERLEEAQVNYHQAQYLYSEGHTGNFMLSDSFEQVAASLDSPAARFLTEGALVDLAFWQDKVIDVRLPKKIEQKVAYTEPAEKGNTVNAALKPAELESGAKIQVPLFVKTGDKVVVNTETGQYDSRV